MYPTLTQVARASALGMFSGPQSSFAAAQAIVSRLKRGQEWAEKRLPAVIGRYAEFSPNSEASNVIDVRLPIIERRASMLLWADFAEEWGVRLRSVPGTIAVRGALGVLTKHSLSVSDSNGGASYIVAPNVLEAGIRSKFDLGDWAKWVALRAAVDRWLSARTLFFKEYCSELVPVAPIDPIDAQELAHQLILRDCIIDVFMESLTPKDLSSVKWIASHRPADFMVDGALITLVGGSVPQGVIQLRCEMASYLRDVVAGPGLESILNPRMWPSFQ